MDPKRLPATQRQSLIEAHVRRMEPWRTEAM